ncbi:hypothetical protein LGH70_22970 [Hymenobacter sp. BT635]|uniref:Uncharacterized protein n=1 Tax=Hymenobacter nitidus TaxID=2880929 RepID=A0ABS8AKA7_9BACT|nr:hypothetical protein [Hymenobacter nitidus]MCB2380474.1 hypothetical protein [Hymenobacter nitidus]
MASPQIVKVVIEVELVDDTTVAVTHAASGQRANAEGAETEQYEQAMLAALRADPASYIEFVKNAAIGSIEAFGVSRELGGLAQVRSYFTANVTLLEKLIPNLPADAQRYFQQATQEGWLADGMELVFDTITATPVKLTVEYPPAQA